MKENSSGRILPSLIFAVALVLFGFSLERAAKHIGHGLDNFGHPFSGWLSEGAEIEIPNSFTIRMESQDKE